MSSNNVKVMDAVRNGKNSASKKDIQRVTGLSWGTMCKTTNLLLEQGYLFARREKTNSPGRPVVPLCVNADSALFCGIDVGAATTKTLFCDMNFNILHRDELPTEPYTTPERFSDWIAEVFHQVLRESGVQKEKLHAVGLAISGNVDSEHGLIVSGGNFGMKYGADIPLTGIAQRIGKPVYAVTTQVAAVCAEYHFGKRAGCGNLVSIGLGVGIGSGIVTNHMLLLSHPKRPVGYIGHILIPSNRHLCTCGFTGCLEAYSGSRYLAEIAKETLPDRPELHSAPALDRAATQGDPDALKIMTTAASYNAVGIAAMIQLYAPDAILFSGGQSRRDGFLFQTTLEKLAEILPPERRSCFLDITNLGAHQSALGAARLAYETFF